MHQYRAAAHGSAPWRTCLVTRQRVLGCFRAARLGADGSDHDHRGRHSCARRAPSPPARAQCPFVFCWRPAAAAGKIGSLRANLGDAHRPGFRCIQHMTTLWSLVCACSSDAATEVGPCLARAGGSRELCARWELQDLVVLAEEMKSPLGLMDKARTSNPKIPGSSPAWGAVASVS